MKDWLSSWGYRRAFDEGRIMALDGFDCDGMLGWSEDARTAWLAGYRDGVERMFWAERQAQKNRPDDGAA